MTTLIWSRSARDDLFAIAEHYREIDPDLPSILLVRITTAPLVLMDQPRLGAPTHVPEVRKWLVRGTPFLLLYAVRPDRVEIRRVVHSSTDWTRA